MIFAGAVAIHYGSNLCQASRRSVVKASYGKKLTKISDWCRMVIFILYLYLQMNFAV
jgi:hypothetical protein